MNQPITDRELALQLIKRRRNAQQAFNFDPDEMRLYLKSRILGQDEIIDQVVDVIEVNSAKTKREEPIARMLFLGPPGTGKTELAAQMATYLFGDATAALKFDCKSQLSSEREATIELMGGQPIWQGAKPGTMTAAVKAKPNMMIIFDEMENAPLEVWNNLLPVLSKPARTRDLYTSDDVDFTRCIFVFTGNALWKEMVKLKNTIDDPEELQNACFQKLVDQKIISPQMRRRFDYVCVFDHLSEEVLLDVLIQKLREEASTFGLTLRYIDPELVAEIYERTKKTAGEDGSVIGTFKIVIEKVLSKHFASAKKAGLVTVVCRTGTEGQPVVEQSASNEST
jgi:ATP-dependent Clp protease ATP-binding subunit ClpC